MTINTNRDRLVAQSIQGKVAHPDMVRYCISRDGEAYMLPSVGAITYNVHVGDPAFGWVGDHIEPGVSTKNDDSEEKHAAYQILSCIGNEACVITGDAKGGKGYVSGKHGTLHLIIQFPDEVQEKMTTDDKILVKGFGLGLSIAGFEDVQIMSLDPDVFDKMKISVEDNKLAVPVAAVIPQHLMGSGVGHQTQHRADYDLMTSDKEQIHALGLNRLRLGDIVLLQDSDNTYGCGDHLKGAVTIGIIVHADSAITGHGPGVTVLMSCKTSRITGKIDPNANLEFYMKQINKAK